MNSFARVRSRGGFTLIEVLVTLILLAVLTAAVFPVMSGQAERGDPVRTAQDLSVIRSGIEQFQLDVRPSFPGDLEDLAYRPVTTDSSIAGGTFTAVQSTRWNGPYLDLSLVQGAAVTGDAQETGFGGQIQTDLVCYNPNNDQNTGTTCTEGLHYVAVMITGLSAQQFETINDMIDGINEVDGTAATESQRLGKFNLRGGVAYYLAAPYRA